MAFGTSMKLTELLTPPPVPSLLSVYADMEVVERRPRTTQSVWNRESLGRDKNVNFHSHLHLCHSSFQLLGKKDLRQRQIKKPKYSIFHFTSWLGYLEVADGRVVSYQLTKFLSGLQFACIEKTVGYVNPVQGGEHYSSWKRFWSLMWHKLYLVLSRITTGVAYFIISLRNYHWTKWFGENQKEDSWGFSCCEIKTLLKYFFF